MSAPRKKLKLWGALALSLGLMGPTLAMAGNGQGLIDQVGAAVPLVFLLGFIGVAMVAYGFVRLTQRYNHAGSAYALVGVTLGPRFGFVAGFALFGTYLFFSICTIALVGDFFNALLGMANGTPHPPQVVWIIPAIVALVLTTFLNTRDTRTVAKWLLIIEGVGITCMIVLSIVIFGHGGNSRTGISWEPFNPGTVGVGPILAAVVAAFLSWAGFEACAALGEETDRPRRNIPRALFGSVLLTGVLFVVVMFAQTVGFGTDKTGLDAFAGSPNTLGDLSLSYVGRWFAIILVVAALMSAFASNLSSLATASRLLFALARDGFGPKVFAEVEPRHHNPRNALLLAAGVALVVNLVSYLTTWPNMGTGDPALDSYFYFAVTGATAILVVYLLVELAVFAAWRRGQITVRAIELIVPALGALLILTVLWYGLKDQTGFAPAYLAVIWVVVGIVIALAAPRLARRIGTSLTRELEPGNESELDAEVAT
jgi:amino acid transporter